LPRKTDSREKLLERFDVQLDARIKMVGQVDVKLATVQKNQDGWVNVEVRKRELLC
jgi:hypothetical protein